MKKVSVIIPCFNQFEYLMEAIQSVLNQTYWQQGDEHSPSIEIIVLDDASTTGQSKLTPEDWFWLTHNEHIVYALHKSNQGLSTARNSAIRIATGEYILPLDADDKIAPTCIEKMVRLAEGYDIVSSYLETFGDYTRVSKPPLSFTYSELKMANRINCCSLFKKTMWERLGGYDEKMLDGYEDWDLWARSMKAGYTIGVIPEILFYYRKHGHTMLSSAKLKRNEIMQYMKNKGSI